MQTIVNVIEPKQGKIIDPACGFYQLCCYGQRQHLNIIHFSKQNIANELGWDMYLCIAYLAIFASIFSFTLLTFASSHLASGQLTAYTFSTPFWVTVFQVAVFGQELLTYLILGGAMIFFSLVVLLWRVQPRAEPKSQTV